MIKKVFTIKISSITYYSLILVQNFSIILIHLLLSKSEDKEIYYICYNILAVYAYIVANISLMANF